jgi:hypothetical protein
VLIEKLKNHSRDAQPGRLCYMILLDFPRVTRDFSRMHEM